jgi:hypothetical protein
MWRASLFAFLQNTRLLCPQLSITLFWGNKRLYVPAMTLLNESPHDKLPEGVASILLQHSGSPHFLREKRQKPLTNVYFDAFVMRFLRKVIQFFPPTPKRWTTTQSILIRQ